MTRRQPTAAQQRDIEFGWRIAKEMGRLDIGQSIAVKEQEVIAVEAIEGTDRMIERAGSLCRHGGWTLIKVAKPDQDLRFDVPTVGPATIENLHRNGASALVVEAATPDQIEWLDGVPAYRAEKNTPLVRSFLAAIRAEGGEPGFTVKSGTSDMNLVAPVWNCPTLAYGPGDSSLDHTPDEHILISEYQRAVRVLARVLGDERLG